MISKWQKCDYSRQTKFDLRVSKMWNRRWLYILCWLSRATKKKRVFIDFQSRIDFQRKRLWNIIKNWWRESFTLIIDFWDVLNCCFFFRKNWFYRLALQRLSKQIVIKLIDNENIDVSSWFFKKITFCCFAKHFQLIINHQKFDHDCFKFFLNFNLHWRLH